MSQWFGGPGRKAGKTPGGAPDGSHGMPRDRSGRPMRPAANPPRERPQAGEYSLEPPPGWEPESRKPASKGQLGRSPAQPPQSPSHPPQRSQAMPARQYQDWSGPPQDDEQMTDSFEETDESQAPERVEFKKRLVALIFDFLACYILAMGVMLVPYLNAFLHVNLVMCLFLLIRDFPFEGRGLGKNLMGLQVVDAASGNPPSLKQSALRNLVLVAPYALTQVVSVILRFIPFSGFNEVVTTIVNFVGALYVIIVIPLEVYRAYNRPDGQRFGDELAKTEVIESSMDFSKPLPRR